MEVFLLIEQFATLSILTLCLITFKLDAITVEIVSVSTDKLVAAFLLRKDHLDALFSAIFITAISWRLGVRVELLVKHFWWVTAHSRLAIDKLIILLLYLAYLRLLGVRGRLLVEYLHASLREENFFGSIERLLCYLMPQSLRAIFISSNFWRLFQFYLWVRLLADALVNIVTEIEVLVLINPRFLLLRLLALRLICAVSHYYMIVWVIVGR